MNKESITQRPTVTRKMPEINGKVEVDYKALKELERMAEAYHKLDPESAAAGVNIAMTARDMLSVESEHNGEGVIAVSRNSLSDFIHLVTGLKPIEIKVLQDNVKAGPYKPEVRI